MAVLSIPTAHNSNQIWHQTPKSVSIQSLGLKLLNRN